MTDSQQNTWKLIENYFETHSIVEDQISSFNHFLLYGIQEVIDNELPIITETSDYNKYEIKFGNVYVSNPILNGKTPLYPRVARITDLNYSGTILCNIIETLYDPTGAIIKQQMYNRVKIAEIPIMLKSCRCNLYKFGKNDIINQGECLQDPGGYFIIKGNERVLVSQIRNNYNQIIIQKCQKDNVSYIAKMRSMSEQTSHSVSILFRMNNENNTIDITIPYVSNSFPLGILFKAYGYKNEDIRQLLSLGTSESDTYIENIIRESYLIKNSEDALNHISKLCKNILDSNRKIEYAKQIIFQELFPHLGILSSTKQKVLLLAMIAKKLISTHLGHRVIDNKDDIKFKRIETCGTLCKELFKTLFKKFLNIIKTNISKKKIYFDINNIISKIKVITVGLKYSFSTGNWGAQKNSYVRLGVSQVMSRMNYHSTISHMKRINIPIGKESKNKLIRQIHPSQLGYICPSETPEGASSGIVLNFSIFTRVTNQIPTFLVISIIKNNLKYTSVDDIDLNQLKTMTAIYLNGILIGFVQCEDEFITKFKLLRRREYIDKNISISYNPIDDEICIFSDAGRVNRPLFRVDEYPSESTDWNHLIKIGSLEYIDAFEIENMTVAMDKNDLSRWNCDYMEIHPCSILGVIANIIPFPDHTQSPRVIYQSNMGKQALGIYSLSYQLRTDTISYTMTYPQKPIVSTKFSKIIKCNDMPCGINAIVAIMTYTGFNQEDSIIMNQSSIDKGLFHINMYKTISVHENKNNFYISEQISIPPENSIGISDNDPKYFKRKYNNYSFLGPDGVIISRYKNGSSVYVKKGDVIVGKVKKTTLKNEGIDTYVDCSTAIKSGEEGFIDKVFVNVYQGIKIVKVVIRQSKIPEVGDKFASRAGQKGTVGGVYRQEDMPFNSEGICPDIIINPHAIPSRMTVNQLMECVLGKTCALEGIEYGDATPFMDIKDRALNICNMLEKAGMKHMNNTGHYYNKYGWETLYNGFTGERIKAKIFMGPTYYQRLKHMVSNKIHSRSYGHVTTLCRQPLDGRSRDGGLRFGEMEKDCMISHGCSEFIKDRLFYSSDPFKVDICLSCGNILNSVNECLICKEESNITEINIPYTSKLLFQELNAMGIKVKLS